MRGSHRTRIVSLADDCCKSNECCCETTRMRWTSSRRIISKHPGKMEDPPRLLKIPKSEVQIFVYVFHDVNGPNHEGTLKIQWFLLTKFVRSPTCRPLVRMTSWGRSTGTWMGEKTKLRMFICSPKTRIVLIGLRG